jgi:hypothetical protein
MTMNRYVLRGTLGRCAGLVSSVFLAGALGNGLLGVALGTAVGVAYGLAVGQRAGGYLDSGMAAAALGVPLWATVSVILLPLTAGEEPYWRAEGNAPRIPGLRRLGAVWPVSRAGDAPREEARRGAMPDQNEVFEELLLQSRFYIGK